MHLAKVFVRFYKSFNFDYLRKYDPNVTVKHPWEFFDGLWYPYVCIPVDEKITTVVGANESGKTHLLTTIEKGLSGETIDHGDFCRHSQFFAVEEGKMRWPDFGFEWTGLTQEEIIIVANECGAAGESFNRFLMFRTQKDNISLYVPQADGYAEHRLKEPASLLKIIPTCFHLKANVALPESVPIRFLIDGTPASKGFESLSRHQRGELFDNVYTNFDKFKTKEIVAQSADLISREMNKFSSQISAPLDSAREVRHREAELALAHDLIRKIARIDSEALKELYEALRDGRDAFANSIIDEINETLRARLNFPNWWVQDREFRLLVSPREHDLVFTIRDRTGMEYAFTERSSGLRYFLSYYIQYLAYERHPTRRQILLMDEPDAFLSNQGQQDLLKIFNAFANPDDGNAPVQLIYVTHSPFLIDKNHGDRIRVLEKGAGEEGTRVVRDAARNHYEPLRSAFGSLVGEMTFMGNCNLIVEGASDQILLVGAATQLRRGRVPEVHTLDLNHITIVPAGGASHVPYLVYLARGRDVEKPAVIVLLDSDTAGNQAKSGILRGGPRHKELLKPHHILQIGDLAADSSVHSAMGGAPVETEDLIPLSICVLAVQKYLTDVSGCDPELVKLVTSESIKKEFVEGVGVFPAIEKALCKIKDELHIEKIGFARAVVTISKEVSTEIGSSSPANTAVSDFEANMKALFGKLGKMQRDAERELSSIRISERVSRAKSSFLLDHSTGAKREQVLVLFEVIESALDNSQEADAIVSELQSLRRDFKIEEDLTEAIDDYPTFKERLERMRYAARLSTQVATLQEAAGPLTEPEPKAAPPVPNGVAKTPE